MGTNNNEHIANTHTPDQQQQQRQQRILPTQTYTASHSRVMRWGRYSAIMLDVNISSQLQSNRAAITLCSEDMLLSIVSV